MDAKLETRIMDHFFQELPATSSLVVVTHKTSVLKHVQRVVVMSQGKVVLDGPTEQVLAQVRGEPTPPPVAPPAVPSSDQGGQV
jgi:ATP-binding cassette subfamily C protein LapB